MKIEASILILITIGNLAYSEPEQSYECLNPNNKLGICISLYACPTLFKLFLNSASNQKDQKFLHKSYCPNGFGVPPHGCCTNDDKLFSDNLPATQEQCTRDPYLSLALWPLSYENNVCVGALINDRYILTSAWCAANAGREIFQLGKTNINDTTIEKRIPHENYTHSDAYEFDHDIGLLRLSRSIQFNQDIAPSCLPGAVSGFKSYKIGDGITFPVYFGSNIRLKEGGEILEKCKDNKYHSPSQLCVGGDIEKYYTDIQYGNPLVAKHDGAWIIDAVYGFHRTEPYAIFARVSDYEKWIHEHLEP